MESQSTTPTPDEALQRLMEGNNRFVHGQITMPHPAAVIKSRLDVAHGQHPFAIVLACADLRVAPELIFDQGLGDIFVVRTAGACADEIAIGSIEYAVEHLGCSLVLVLGHQRCGAITAAVEGGDAPGCIEHLVDTIRPAVEETKDEPGDKVENALRAHTTDIARELATLNPILRPAVEAGELKILAGRYDLGSGLVGLFEPA